MLPAIVRIAALLAMLSSVACESLTQSEKEVVRDLRHFQLDIETEYSRGTATALNFLPGIGNFYLDQTGLGVMNLLFWPISIVWGMPQAWVDTPVMNEKYTADYYRTRAGQLKMQEHLQVLQIPPEEWPYWIRR